jgi:hypothetical protein
VPNTKTWSLIPIIACAATPSLCLFGQNQITNAAWVNNFPAMVAPGEIVTLETTPLSVPDAAATQFPLPTTLSGVSVNVRVIGALKAIGESYPTTLPIFSVHSRTGSPDCADIGCGETAVTVQIPTEGVCLPSDVPPLQCSPSNYLPPLLLLNVVANGVTGPDFPMGMAPSYAHILNSCDAIFGLGPFSNCYPLITHADGTLVEVAASTSTAGSSPAKVGEAITIYAVGLGVPVPGVPPTGTAPSSPIALPLSLGAVVFGYQYPISGVSSLPGGAAANTAASQTTVQPTWVGLVPDYAGLYQINVTVPRAPSGSYPSCAYLGNATVAIGASLVLICVLPQAASAP